MKHRMLSGMIYGLSSAIGLVAFMYPFIAPELLASHMNRMGQAHGGDAPLMLTMLVGLSFVALLFDIQGQTMNTKVIALLGVLVSMNAVLRFVEVAIPGPGGFSPIFVLITLTGYVYGGRFGFQMGVMTLIVSALITGALGPWLPYQMLTAGWVGLTAPLCRVATRLFHRWLPRWQEHSEVAVLVLFGALWGFLYGVVMNIWFWPFMSGPVSQAWNPDSTLIEALQRYTTFYLLTSLGWDVFRAFGNGALIAIVGIPVLRTLRRFQQRFDFAYRALP
jgi:energy-coupling factor transport system substrate-specific component